MIAGFEGAGLIPRARVEAGNTMGNPRPAIAAEAVLRKVRLEIVLLHLFILVYSISTIICF